MAYEQILVENSEGIATITLHRPDKMNAWTLRLGAEVRHAMLSAERDESVRVVIVTGSGRGYCAGADMDMLQGLQRGDAGVSDPGFADLAIDPGPDAPALLRSEYGYPLGMTKPVLAAVNGAAVGLGISYMLFYDLRFASDRARFSFIFPRRGLIAEHGSAWILPRLVGPAAAADLLFSGRMVSAEEALAMGLVNRVVPHDELLGHVRDYARELATQCSPRSIGIIKQQLLAAQGPGMDLVESIRDADRQMIESFPTADFREGVLSFLQRRPPKFVGR